MKILIKQLGRIGDMICLSACLPLIKKAFPDGEIDIVASKHNHIIIENNPYVNNAIKYNKTLFNIFSVIKQIRSTKYDFYFDPKDHFSGESKIFSKIVKAEVKVGYNLPGKHTFDIGLDSAERNINLHFIERALKAFRVLALDKKLGQIPRPKLFPSKQSEEFAKKFHENYFGDEQYTIINISANGENRKWNTGNWIELIKQTDLAERDIVICSAPDDKHKAEEIVSNFQNVKYYPSKSIEETFGLVQKAEMLLTCDTAMVHIASAYNTPIIALYPGVQWNTNKFAPLSDKKCLIFAPEGKSNVNTIKIDEVVNNYYSFIKKL